MKRRGRLGIVVCVILILLSAGLFVSAATGILDVNDKSPVSEVLKMGARLGLSRNEEDEIPKPIGRPREVGLHEPFVTHGVEVTVQSIRIGKARGDLPLMHPNDFVMRDPPKTDENGTFLDDNLYIDVELTLENAASKSREAPESSTGNQSGDQPETMDFYLSACQVITDYGESLANPVELSLSDLSDLSSHSPDAGKLELAAGEVVSGHVGYVIAEKRLVDLPSLFFTVDVTGNVTMDPGYADTSWVSIQTERS